ncbi:MAG: CARDB domain-containing protein [Desulfatiglandales bacterium]
MKRNAIIPFLSLMMIISCTYVLSGQAARMTPKTMERKQLDKTEKMERRVPAEKIRKAVEKPDLTISRLTVSKRKIFTGDDVTISATISHKGTHSLSGVTVHFYVDKRQVGSDTIRGIKPNSSQAATIPFRAEQEGRYTITAVVDPHNTIAETNDRNNSMKETITIASLPVRTVKKAKVKAIEKKPVPKVAELKPAQKKVIEKRVTEKEPSRIARLKLAHKPPLKASLIPQITSVRPDTLVQGQTYELTLTGSNLDEGMSLSFGPGIEVESFKVSRFKKSAALQVCVEKIARPGIRTVLLSFGGRRMGIAKVTVKEASHPGVGMEKRQVSKGIRRVEPGGKSNSLGLTPLDATLEALEVTYPTGKLAEIRGYEMRIDWSVTSGLSAATFILDLYQYKKKIMTISPKSQKSSSGGGKMYFKAVWDIPPNLPVGRYLVKVTTSDGLYADGSAYFDIREEGLQILVPTKVVSWVRGCTYAIQWLTHFPYAKWAQKSQEKAELWLLKSGAQVQKIAVINDYITIYGHAENYSWTIPSNLPPGSYMVRLASQDGQYAADSESFQILAQPASPKKVISVSQPDKLDKWAATGGFQRFVDWRLDQELLDNQAMGYKPPGFTLKLHDSTGATVATTSAPGAAPAAFFGSLDWQPLNPSTTIHDGQYVVRVETADGLYYGLSDPFTVWVPKPPVFLKDQKPTTLLSQTKKDRDKPVRATNAYFPPSGVEPLKITAMIKSLNPKAYTLSGAYGSYARLSYVDIVLEIQANKPFKFEASLDPKAYKNAAAAWSLVVPEVKVLGYVFPKNLKGLYLGDYFIDVTKDAYYNDFDPTGSYPWQKTYSIGSLGPFEYPHGIIPKGKSTMTFRVNDPGVIHGLKVIGLAQGKKEVWIGVTKKYETVSYKCVQYCYPAISVLVRLKYKAMPEYDVYGKVPLTSSVLEAKGYLFSNPQAVQTLDTTLGPNQMDFQPPWSSPVKFSSKNCEPFDKTLVGGW